LSLFRLLSVALACLLVMLVTGCGGGGDGCEQTGTVEFVYTPAVRANSEDALTYKLGQTNTWTLRVNGVTQACLKGLKVSVPPGRPALPAGVMLDAATGTLSTGVMNQHIEGDCMLEATVTGTSVNRICPPGTTLRDVRYVLLIQSDHVNNETLNNTGISFRPAP